VTSTSATYINPDLTPEQAKLAYVARQKRRARNQQQQRLASVTDSPSLQMTSLTSNLFMNSMELAKCYLFNAQSIVNILSESHHIIYANNCDCIFITGTWLSTHITDGLLDHRPSFTIIRRDRHLSRWGGVCAFVRNSYSIISLIIPSKYDILEVTGFDLVNAQPSIRFILFYRPPYNDSTAERVALTFVEFPNEYATCSDKRHIIVGDLNLPHINWNDFTCPTDCINSVFVDFVINNGFSQMVNFSTRHNNLLDIGLTDDNMIVANLDSHPPIGLSDHVIIEFDVVLTFKVYPDPNVNYIPQSKYLWRDAVYESMSAYLSSIDWFTVCCHNPSAQSLWNAFTDILCTAVSLFVPTHHPNRPRGCTSCRTKPTIILKLCTSVPLRNADYGGKLSLPPMILCCKVNIVIVFWNGADL